MGSVSGWVCVQVSLCQGNLCSHLLLSSLGFSLVTRKMDGALQGTARAAECVCSGKWKSALEAK